MIDGELRWRCEMTERECWRDLCAANSRLRHEDRDRGSGNRRFVDCLLHDHSNGGRDAQRWPTILGRETTGPVS